MPIDGTSGDDLLNGTSGSDTINGLGGNDTLYGLAGNDLIDGGGGNDHLIAGGAYPSSGTEYFDTLIGGLGNDTLELSTFNAVPDFVGGLFDGGAGVDTLIFRNDWGDIPYFNYNPNNPSADFRLWESQTGFAYGTVRIANIELIEYYWIPTGSVTTLELGVGTNAANNLSPSLGVRYFAFGGAGADTLTGGSMDDSLAGDGGNDSVTGASGNDTLVGGLGADTLTGGAGSDLFQVSFESGLGGASEIITDFNLEDFIEVLFPGLSVPRLHFIGSGAFSGSGEEFRFRTAGGQTIIEFDYDGDATADSNVVIATGAFSLRYSEDYLFLEIAVLGAATAGADTLRGTVGSDNLSGLAGNDRLIGYLGDDTITGGDGDDYIAGDEGADILTGGLGADWFTWANLPGEIVWNSSVVTDTVTDLDPVDTISLPRWYWNKIIGDYVQRNWIGLMAFSGSAGEIRYQKFAGRTEVQIDVDGDAVADHIINITNGAFDLWHSSGLVRMVSSAPTSGNDSISGIDGDDSIDGIGGNDYILGGLGNDTLVGGSGADTLDGGSGVDILSYQGSSAGVSINLSTGAVSGGDAAGDVISNFEHVYGSTKNDTLTGDGGGNDLRGSIGNDWISGGAGNDTVGGGAGNDTLFGGANPDWLAGHAGADVLDGGASVDKADYTTAPTGVNVNLATGGISGDAAGDTYVSIEIVSGSNYNDTLTGSNAGDDLRGRGGSDILNGSAGNDKLYGYSGNDTLIGGDGNDTLTGGGHNDRYVFSGAFGDDTIADMNAGALIRDVIEINGFGPAFDSFAEILAVTTDVGGNAVIDINGNTITLMGVTKAQLDANDFIFT